MAAKKEEKKTTTAKVEKAKGRPMLHWVGKKTIDSVRSYPAQLVEQYSCTGTKAEETNLLFHGDNKEVLAYLLTNGYRGKVDLIYIDPPFDSKADYVRKVELRGFKSLVKSCPFKWWASSEKIPKFGRLAKACNRRFATSVSSFSFVSNSLI